MQRDDVGLAKQIVESPRSGLLLGPHGRCRRNLGVEGDDAHPECTTQMRRLPADAAEADHAQRLAGELAAVGERGARPFSRSHRRRAGIGTAQQQHRRTDDVLGDGERIGPGCRDHLDAARFAGRKIDVVEADSKPADDAQLACGGDELAIDPRLVAHDQRVRIGDHAEKVFAPGDEFRIVGRGEPPLQRGDGCLVHEFGDEDVHGRADYCMACAQVPQLCMPQRRTVRASTLRKITFSTRSPMTITVRRPANTLGISS